MDWAKVKNVPTYNPVRIKLMRELEGLAKYEIARKAKIATKRYSDIESGNILPTDEEIDRLIASQTHVIKGFLTIFDLCETVFKEYGGVPRKINYYQFKIFRDINPPQSMKAV